LLEIASNPNLLAQLKEPSVDVFRRTLDAHRYALNLDPDNADGLFNTAESMTGLAVEIANGDDGPEASSSEVFKLLQEGLELFRRCLSVQKLQYDQDLQRERLAGEQEDETSREEAVSAPERPEAPVPSSEEEDDDDEEEQYATIIHPVTLDDMVDTVTTQLDTLSILCDIGSKSSSPTLPISLEWIEEYADEAVKKLPALPEDDLEKLHEFALSSAKFTAARLEASFRVGKVAASAWKKQLDTAFTSFGLSTNGSEEPLMAYADALVSFTDTLFLVQPSESAVRWTAFLETIKHLTTASNIRGISGSDLSATHLHRGDARLSMYTMGHPPVSHKSAIENAESLLKNGMISYRNASKLSQDPEEKAIAGLRSQIAEQLLQAAQGKSFDPAPIFTKGSANGREWVEAQVEDMRDEGLLPQSFQL
jgi:hypothetical protein